MPTTSDHCHDAIRELHNAQASLEDARRHYRGLETNMGFEAELDALNRRIGKMISRFEEVRTRSSDGRAV